MTDNELDSHEVITNEATGQEFAVGEIEQLLTLAYPGSPVLDDLPWLSQELEDRAAGNIGFAIDRDTPWLWFEIARVLGRIAFPQAKFIKIVVADDIAKRIGHEFPCCSRIVGTRVICI